MYKNLKKCYDSLKLITEIKGLEGISAVQSVQII